MRARGIKPGFFKNEILADIGPCGQLLFEGLWCLADREGRLEDRPRRIQCEIFPYYEPNPSVDDLLQSLAEKGFIVRYSVNGSSSAYIQIINFKKHQTPHIRESASILPSPEQGTAKAQPRHSLGECQTSPRSPDFLTPDSLIPDSNKRHCPSYDGLFEVFWKNYPRKEGKAGAYRVWKRLKNHSEIIEKMKITLPKQKVSFNWTKENGQFIPLPKTYLTNGRWEDETIE